MNIMNVMLRRSKRQQCRHLAKITRIPANMMNNSLLPRRQHRCRREMGWCAAPHKTGYKKTIPGGNTGTGETYKYHRPHRHYCQHHQLHHQSCSTVYLTFYLKRACMPVEAKDRWTNSTKLTTTLSCKHNLGRHREHAQSQR